jgi:hypothetical protein
MKDGSLQSEYIMNELIDWFLYSRIFDGEAYLEYYSARRSGPKYPEITGYAISLCCMLYQRNKDRRFIDRAETCVNFMTRIVKAGGVPCLRDNLLYSFDTGVYVSGLFNLYALTKKQVYLSEAEKSLQWTYSLWNRSRFAAVNRVPKNRDWYHVPSVHLSKLVIPLIKASEVFNEQEYMSTALELLEKCKKLQNEDGGFRINESSNRIMTHPHCYATEGVLYAYHKSKRQELLDVAEKSAAWLRKAQNPDGSFNLSYGIDKNTRRERARNRIKATDSTAQATRIWKLLGVNHSGIRKAYNYLNSQRKDNGLGLYRIPSMRASVYSWPTFFYMHSLMLPFRQLEYSNELF